MATYISPNGNPEIWNHRPEGYFTPEEWAVAHPAPEPASAPDDSPLAKLAAVEAELCRLDAEFLNPRTLANLALGDEFARARYEKHEAAAAPLRRERAELALLIKEDPDAEN